MKCARKKILNSQNQLYNRLNKSLAMTRGVIINRPHTILHCNVKSSKVKLLDKTDDI